ncbi:hypothetical protein LBMAG27_19850 [Bacteroidota bacterium]|nr:hypothetical protein LBMAG27_19850 [Bacteroidota bacterium]
MSALKRIVKKIPILGSVTVSAIDFLKGRKFKGSAQYWEERYAAGGNSGSGSYNKLAEYKAEVLNRFVKENNIQKVMEFGCGDGNQLSLAQYPQYIGLDVSPTAIQLCMNKFQSDKTKSFYLYQSLAFNDNQKIFQADLTLSLDVLYHLIEEEIFNAYLTHLFSASTKYVIIYAGDFEKGQNFHEKDRKFTTRVERNFPQWKLINKIENPFRNAANLEDKSKADFYFYQKQG